MQNGQVPRPSIRLLTTPSNVVLTPGNPRGLVALVLHQADPTIQRLLGSIHDLLFFTQDNWWFQAFHMLSHWSHTEDLPSLLNSLNS